MNDREKKTKVHWKITQNSEPQRPKSESKIIFFVFSVFFFSQAYASQHRLVRMYAIAVLWIYRIGKNNHPIQFVSECRSKLRKKNKEPNTRIVFRWKNKKNTEKKDETKHQLLKLEGKTHTRSRTTKKKTITSHKKASSVHCSILWTAGDWVSNITTHKTFSTKSSDHSRVNSFQCK